MTYKPALTWIKSRKAGVSIPFYGKVKSERIVIDAKKNKSFQITVSAVVCELTTVMSPVEVSCIGTGTSQHWPGQTCELDGQGGAPYIYYSSRVVNVCADDGTQLDPATWRQVPTEQTPYGTVIYPPTEPVEPCLEGVGGTCDPSDPNTQAAISMTQFLANELSLSYDVGYMSYLNTSPNVVMALYIYLQSNGMTQENKDFAVWSIDYLRLNSNVSIEDFSSWYLRQSDGGDGDYNAEFWTNPHQTFPAQALPTYNEFLSAFPKTQNQHGSYGVVYGPNVYQLIGGEIYNKHLATPAKYQNACALRVSRALQYSRAANNNPIRIPHIHAQTFLGADGLYYFLSAANLSNWMRETFGTPSDANNITNAEAGVNGRAIPGLLNNKKGIYIMKANYPGENYFGASEHADIISNKVCNGHCWFNPKGGIEYIDIYPLQ